MAKNTRKDRSTALYEAVLDLRGLVGLGAGPLEPYLERDIRRFGSRVFFLAASAVGEALRQAPESRVYRLLGAGVGSNSRRPCNFRETTAGRKLKMGM